MNFFFYNELIDHRMLQNAHQMIESKNLNVQNHIIITWKQNIG